MSGIADVTRSQVDIDEFAFHTHVRERRATPRIESELRGGARPRGIMRENFDASAPQEIIPSRNFAAFENDTFAVSVSGEVGKIFLFENRIYLSDNKKKISCKINHYK